ncbi:hypothetical protein A4X09_0g2480 [Tilletia walkeri]|uniref:Plasma membrane fusion protein PRM1 n=1 Tax=Tilletia walkeri TaxID=117179 RepID=A0A8X7NBF1_9BASI|nr:hypothetical protein A4X09_0g2480 [Tilletia walkeri]
MRLPAFSATSAPSARWRITKRPPIDPRHLLFHAPSSSHSNSPPPFLGLRSRLALAILSPPLLSLLVLLIAIAIPLLTPGASPIETRIEQAKDRLTAACAGVQAAAGAIQGVPHYMAAGTNRMIANGVEFTVTSLGHLLLLLLFATEKVLIYLVDTYRSLLQCLIELLIRGVLAILIQVVDILSDGINSASQGIKSAVQAAVSSVNTVISSALAGVNDVLHIVGKSVSVPQIGVPDLTALDNVRLPTFFEDGLIALNNSIPTLDQVKDKINAVISAPLELLRTDVNNTINAFQFDRSVLVVPPLPSTALQVCNSTTIAAATTPLDELAHAVHKLEIFLLLALLLAMLLVALCTVGLEWWAWRSMWRHVRLIRDVCGREKGESIDVPESEKQKAAEAKKMELSDDQVDSNNGHYDTDAHRRALESYRSRTQDPSSSYWINPPDLSQHAHSTDHLQHQRSDNASDHHSISLHTPARAQSTHANSTGPPNTNTPPTRFVVVSDHCIALPNNDPTGQVADSAQRDVPDPLSSDRSTLDLVHLIHHPLSSSLSLRLASFLRIRQAQTLDGIRWYLGGWLGHAGMLALLAFAVFGAISSEIHILALERLATEYDHRLSGSLNDFTVEIRDQLQASFLGQSVAYANQVNAHINTYEHNINQDVFGWVNTTTTTMNNTLNEFVDLVEEAINDIFNSTILYSPVQNFLNCILIRKIEGIETALTWVQHNAQVSLARVDPDVLTLDDGGMNDLLNPITNLGQGVNDPGSAATNGSGGASNSAASEPTVHRIVQGQLDSLRHQRNFFLIMLAFWVALAVLGFIWMLGRIRERRDSGERSFSDMTITHPTPTPGEKDGYAYEMDDIAVGHRSESQPPLTGDGSQRAPLTAWRDRWERRRSLRSGEPF